MVELLIEKVNNLQPTAESIRPIRFIAEKVKVKSVYILVLVLSACLFIISCCLNTILVSRIVGISYPGIRTVTIMCKKDAKEQWKGLLVYWSIYGLFNFIDEFFVSSDPHSHIMRVIPYFHLLKVIIFLWLILPQSEGAQNLYVSFCKPLCNKYSKQMIQLCYFVQEVIELPGTMDIQPQSL